MSRLNDLAINYCCDKRYFHSYIPFYEELFMRRSVKRLLEIGIGYKDLMEPLVPHYVHGASLRMWQDFFPKAEIFACDIREDTLINEDRIHSYVCDQSSPLALLDLVAVSGGDWDVIIDDGSHQTEHQLITAITLLPYLRKGGVYIVEDVGEPERVAKALDGEIHSFPLRWDDNLVVITK